jgi:hypothetical protein
MSNSLFPFDFNPSNITGQGTSVYTVPANKFARVLLVARTTGSGGELYIKKSGGSTKYLNTSATSNITIITRAQGTFTLLSIASGYTARRTNVAVTIVSSNGTMDLKYGGTTFITIPQSGSNSSSSIVDHAGPGNFEQVNNGAGNTNITSGSISLHVFRNEELMPDLVDDAISPAAIAGELWLSAGDEISFEGGLLINEYDQPS